MFAPFLPMSCIGLIAGFMYAGAPAYGAETIESAFALARLRQAAGLPGDIRASGAGRRVPLMSAMDGDEPTGFTDGKTCVSGRSVAPDRVSISAHQPLPAVIGALLVISERLTKGRMDDFGLFFPSPFILRLPINDLRVTPLHRGLTLQEGHPSDP